MAISLYTLLNITKSKHLTREELQNLPSGTFLVLIAAMNSRGFIFKSHGDDYTESLSQYNTKIVLVKLYPTKVILSNTDRYIGYYILKEFSHMAYNIYFDYMNVHFAFIPVPWELEKETQFQI